MSEEYKYTMIVGALPNPMFHPKQAKKVAKFLKGLDGFYGIYPMWDKDHGYTTMLVFDTYNNAKTARRELRREGNGVSTYIMKAKLEADGSLTVLEPAEGEVV